VPVDDPLDVGKSDAGSLKVLRAMEALENSEQLRGVSHIETNAVIAHIKYRLGRGGIVAAPRQLADFDLRLLARLVYLRALSKRFVQTSRSRLGSPATWPAA
jgi:hypothetical protein